MTPTKIPTLPFALWLLVSLLPASGQTANPPKPVKPPKPIHVETRWPGIMVTVYQIARLPENRVSVKFIYEASGSAPNETYIADRPLKGFPNISRGSDDPGQPTPLDYSHGIGSKAPEEYYPYSIEKKGKLIDEATGKTFSPADLKPGDEVHPGQTETLEVVRPGGAFFLGGVFECPPVTQDDPPKPQWVTLQLPGLKGPVKGVLLPREENVPLNYFPKPKTLSRSAPPPPPPPN